MHKDNIYHNQITVGGNNIIYKGYVGTPTANLETVKMLSNSIISTMEGKFMTMDTKKIYLNTLLENYEYLRICIDNVPQYFINKYNLISKIKMNGYTSTL